MVGEGVGGDFELWKLLEDPDEVFPRVDLPATAALDEGEPDGVALSRFLAAHEEPVFRAQFGGADAVFNEVVIDLQPAVLETGFEFTKSGFLTRLFDMNLDSKRLPEREGIFRGRGVGRSGIAQKCVGRQIPLPSHRTPVNVTHSTLPLRACI